MTHAQAFRGHAFEHAHESQEARVRSCHEPLTYAGASFHSDISWELYRCAACGVTVWTVGGGAHWWNYETSAAGAEVRS